MCPKKGDMHIYHIFLQMLKAETRFKHTIELYELTELYVPSRSPWHYGLLLSYHWASAGTLLGRNRRPYLCRRIGSSWTRRGSIVVHSAALLGALVEQSQEQSQVGQHHGLVLKRLETVLDGKPLLQNSNMCHF